MGGESGTGRQDRCFQKDGSAVTETVGRFCSYYELMRSYVSAGHIQSSLDRGAFVRPQDLLPDGIMHLLGAGRNKHSYAYGPEAGDYDLRRAIVSLENTRWGTGYEIDNVALVPGAWAGVELVLEEIFGLRGGRVEPGALAVVGPTHYQLFHRAITFLGVDIRVFDFALSDAPHRPECIGDLECVFATAPRAIIFTNPNNPDGLYLAPKLLKEIVERCRTEGVILILDEIQDFLTRSSSPGLSYGPWIEAPHVIRIDSFSKKRALADYRVGWVLADAGILGTRISGVIGRMSGLMGNAPRAANTALLELLRLETEHCRGGADLLAPAWSELLRKEEYVMTVLTRCKRATVLPTEACVNVCVRIAESHNDLSLAESLMELGTLMMPCGGYGHNPADSVLRITFAERWEKLEHGMAALELLLNS